MEWFSTQRNVSTCPECRHMFPFGFDKNYLRLTKADVFLTEVLRQTVYYSCPRSCGDMIHPSRQTNHDDACRELPIACDNRVFGCTEMISRKHVRDHIDKCRFHACDAIVLGCPFVSSKEGVAMHERGCFMHNIKAYVDRLGLQRQETTVSQNQNRRHQHSPNISTNIIDGLMTATLMSPELRQQAMNPPTRQAMQDMSMPGITRTAGDHSVINVSIGDLQTLASTFGHIGQAPPPTG